jgi:hypothetical protein
MSRDWFKTSFLDFPHAVAMVQLAGKQPTTVRYSK